MRTIRSRGVSRAVFSLLVTLPVLFESGAAGLDMYPDAAGGARSGTQFRISIDSIGGAIANVETLSVNAQYREQAGIYRAESFFAAPAGEVPEDPLSLSIVSGNLTLSWNRSCGTGDFDYALYEGTLGAWFSHGLKICSTGGATTATIPLPAGNTYYLITPQNAGTEGSYGRASDGSERPVGAPECLPQLAVACP